MTDIIINEQLTDFLNFVNAHKILHMNLKL